MIVITGTQANCEDARCCILAIEKDLLEYGGHHLTLPVPQKYHGRIIGGQGANIKPICTEHNVRVLFPEKNGDYMDEITIIGSEDNARAAQEAIVEGIEEVISEAVPLDSRVYDRVSNKSHQIVHKFKVDITCPQKKAGEVNHMTVTGRHERVNEVIDHHINLEEELMLAVKEKAQIPAGDRAAATIEEEAESPARGRALADIEEEAESPLTPDEYNAPDISCTVDFPTIGAPVANKTNFSQAWR